MESAKKGKFKRKSTTVKRKRNSVPVEIIEPIVETPKVPDGDIEMKQTPGNRSIKRKATKFSVAKYKKQLESDLENS